MIKVCITASKEDVSSRFRSKDHIIKHEFRKMVFHETASRDYHIVLVTKLSWKWPIIPANPHLISILIDSFTFYNVYEVLSTINAVEVFKSIFLKFLTENPCSTSKIKEFCGFSVKWLWILKVSYCLCQDKGVIVVNDLHGIIILFTKFLINGIYTFFIGTAGWVRKPSYSMWVFSEFLLWIWSSPLHISVKYNYWIN